MVNDNVLVSNIDDITVATTFDNDDFIKEIFNKAAKEYDASNKKYSVYLKGTNSDEELTHELLEDLAKDCRNKIESIIKINSLIEKEITLNGIIGNLKIAV